MKHKTFLRAAARKIGMDASQLQKLADKFSVPLTTEAALIALGREHQRESRPENEDVVPMSVVKEEIRKLCETTRLRHDRQMQQVWKIIKAQTSEGNALRQALIDLVAILDPVLRVPWQSSIGFPLTAEAVSEIQCFFDKDYEAKLAMLKQRQAEMEWMVKNEPV